MDGTGFVSRSAEEDRPTDVLLLNYVLVYKPSHAQIIGPSLQPRTRNQEIAKVEFKSKAVIGQLDGMALSSCSSLLHARQHPSTRRYRRSSRASIHHTVP
jgi:hypothetical protein